MEEWFVDTTFLVARFNLRDTNHKSALSLLRDLAEGKAGTFRLVTTDYVFDEMVTAILARTGRQGLAAEAGRAILGSKAWRLEVLSRQDFERGWTLFLERKDKRWSFTDCTSFAFMEHRGFKKALSFDRNFAQAGFAMFP